MPGHDIIVVGTSAGGVETLSQLVKSLPKDFPAAMFIVLHLPASEKSLLPKILSRRGTLPVHSAVDGEAIQPGHIYVAPPNRHLLVNRGYINLVEGPKENGHRPAIDPLFRAAARAYQNRVVGVVLSGLLDDGTAGLMEIKQHGGVAIAQDPDDALFCSMPKSAIEHVDVDYILPIAEIGALLVRLANKPVAEAEGESMPDEVESGDMADAKVTNQPTDERNGQPSEFVCPECGGTLWELQGTEFARFRCRTGHAYSGQSLLAEQSQHLEAALWNAIRLLDERATLLSRMASQARARNHVFSADQYEEKMQSFKQSAELIRTALHQKLNAG